MLKKLFKLKFLILNLLLMGENFTNKSFASDVSNNFDPLKEYQLDMGLVKKYKQIFKDTSHNVLIIGKTSQEIEELKKQNINTEGWIGLHNNEFDDPTKALIIDFNKTDFWRTGCLFRGMFNEVKFDDCTIEHCSSPKILLSTIANMLKPGGKVSFPMRFTLVTDLNNPKITDYVTAKETVINNLLSLDKKDQLRFGIQGKPISYNDPEMKKFYEIEIEDLKTKINHAKKLFASANNDYKNPEFKKFLHENNIFRTTYEHLTTSEDDKNFQSTIANYVLTKKLSREIFRDIVWPNFFVPNLNLDFNNIDIDYDSDVEQSMGFTSNYRKNADMIVTLVKK